ncbi:hypothetical protein [Sphingomonas sp. 35-24ZXX]|uniref:hypothetical protein n=1 Tax=Sphingomonas sp. 35-24ZXX TaxID=1545915 RepID=UPI0012E05A9C|nr:hypothetical protein [Sphingomonas sp. 35-24ZXX]
MMWRNIVIATVFCAMVIGLTVALSSPRLERDAAGAVAAAIAENFGEFVKVAPLTGARRSEIDSETLCLNANGQVQVKDVARKLETTFLRVVPESFCKKKVVEGDFGMFTAMTYYYNEKEIKSAHLKIAKFECSLDRKCSVDIDKLGSGMRYNCIQSGKGWKVVSSDLRWVV